jgi:hypothetical protein
MITLEELEKEHLSSIINESHFYDFLNKWGFMDGDMLRKKDKPIIKDLVKNIVENAPPIDDWKAIAVETGHNPYYICFMNADEDNWIDFYDIKDPIKRLKIEKILSPVVKKEVEKMRRRLNLD